ncbi:MAG: hypothetical protein WKF41_14305 [Gaiellaceae bacterium]
MSSASPLAQTADDAGAPSEAKGRAGRQVRVLFQLPYPGYLRMYGSTVALLADRGHKVLLSYDAPEKRRDAPADELEAHENVELVSPLPPAGRRFEDAILKLRQAMDFIRYLDPRFAEAPYLRKRVERNLPDRLRFLARAPSAIPFSGVATRVMLGLERLVPSDGGVERAILGSEPDVVLVTPLIGRTPAGIRQTDTVKAARRLGVPVGVAVASWDQLTTKGLVKVLPDRVFVWNEGQKREAVDLHRARAADVVVTGAQLFDGWFAREPSTSRATFLERIGLDPAVQYVLYAGSSRAIAPAEKEIPFVRGWLDALRGSGDDSLSGLGVLIRPHPGNVEEWAQVELADARTAIVPKARPNIPMSSEDEALYYDSIHFSAAVVGINTSAMVESFIQRRPVLTISDPRFHETQGGTLHFQHLLPSSGGAVQHAATLDEHHVQLRAALDEPDGHRASIESFLRTFVRPHGLDVPATPILVDAIEELATLARLRGSTPS